MSTSDFERAVNFLQGALDAATSEVSAEKPVADEVPAHSAASEEPQVASPEAEPSPSEVEPVVKPTEAAAEKPMEAQMKLFAELPSEAPVEKATETPTESSVEACVENPTEKDGEPQAESPSGTSAVGVGKLVACLVVAVGVSVAVVAAVKLIRPRVVTETVVKTETVVRESPDTIPLALLPETADAALWSVVSSMRGKIDGVEVAFSRGLAKAGGTTYKVCLDFCASGAEIYAKVSGRGTWVVKVASDGTILKAYPARANGKPLKAIFGKSEARQSH